MTSRRREPVRGPRHGLDLPGAWRELKFRVEDASRGGFNRTHLRRIGRAFSFAAFSHPIFHLLFIVGVVTLFLALRGPIPRVIPGVLLALPCALGSLSYLTEALLAIWEKRVAAALGGLVLAVLLGSMAAVFFKSIAFWHPQPSVHDPLTPQAAPSPQR